MYGFAWYDKGICKSVTNLETKGVLRPCKEESVNFDETENLYIEGDNLEVLKLLQKSYYGKIKMIYIDPPYNTGKDFVYKDNFKDNLQNYLEVTGQVDGEGKRISANQETAGRYHSNWLNMMYPRLFLAKQLLKDDGVIFVSIDDNEQANLRKVCDEIFGEENFVAEIAYQGLDTVKNDAKYFSDNHEYVICYAKQKSYATIKGQKRTEEHNQVYKNYDNDPKGPYLLTPLHAKSGNINNQYEYTFTNGVKFSPPQGTYHRFSRESLSNMEKSGQIYFGAVVPQKKTYLSEVSDYVKLTTFWDYKLAGSTRQSNKEIAELVDKGMFDNPKPVKLLRLLIDTIVEKDEIILDFFSGSATTAHAVMQLNAEDEGNRKYIMVQLPETTDEKSEAYKAGYKNICEIGKERIRRAGNKILEELKEKNKQLELGEEPKNIKLDTGFKVLKLRNNQ